MKKQFSFIIPWILALTSTISAQDFNGKATYKSAMKMQFTTDSTRVSAEEQSQIQAQLMQAMQKDYELGFTKTESNWRELEKLEKGPVPSSGIQVNIVGMGGGSDGLLYKNTKEKTLLETTDGFGKLFLISGELKPYEWEMTAETKQIGKYTCYKAIAKREVTEMHITDVNGEQKEEETKRTQVITAWYTPEIPVNHGPDGYWGLPGLILEVGNGNRILVCNKVVMNPREGVTIDIPSKGKKVTSAEFEELMQKQAKKMNKMYRGGRKKGKNGNTLEIKIQG